jgi:hypothetical protein
MVYLQIIHLSKKISLPAFKYTNISQRKIITYSGSIKVAILEASAADDGKK